jgi:hypothetical protein
MTEEQVRAIAVRIYSVIRALNNEFGKLYPAWEHAGDDQQTTFIEGVRFHLNNPDMTPKETHDWWMEDKAAKGWTYGPVKDEVAKHHPSMIPYEDLSELERGKDVVFIELCRILSSLV